MTRRGRVAAVVPAAGRGSRLGGDRKQFRMLGDAPLLVQTLRMLERHAEIDHYCVALPASAAGIPCRDELHKLRAVVKGGATRSISVAKALAGTDADLILVHDAVRPFVEPALVSSVIALARRFGAAALALPVADTVRYGDSGCFARAVSREDLFRMQTPQGFRRPLLEAALGAGGEATDEVEPVMNMGHAVHIVHGSAWNFKITTPEDWALARALWPRWQEEHPCA